jgi:hypothetical protein
MLEIPTTRQVMPKKHGRGMYAPELVGPPELTYELAEHERRVREGRIH